MLILPIQIHQVFHSIYGDRHEKFPIMRDKSRQEFGIIIRNDRVDGFQ